MASFQPESLLQTLKNAVWQDNATTAPFLPFLWSSPIDIQNQNSQSVSAIQRLTDWLSRIRLYSLSEKGDIKGPNVKSSESFSFDVTHTLFLIQYETILFFIPAWHISFHRRRYPQRSFRLSSSPHRSVSKDPSAPMALRQSLHLHPNADETESDFLLQKYL